MAICGNDGNDKGCCCCVDSSFGVTFFGVCYVLALFGAVGEYFYAKELNTKGMEGMRYGATGDYVWVARDEQLEYKWEYMNAT